MVLQVSLILDGVGDMARLLQLKGTSIGHWKIGNNECTPLKAHA